MPCCITELKEKEVVNISDGARLGFVCDVEIDTSEGRLVSLVVPGHRGFFSFGKESDYIIPWERIKKIGEDIILVDMNFEYHSSRYK